MRKTISINLIKSNTGIPLKDFEYVEYAKEYLSGAPVGGSKYLGFLLKELSKRKNIWGYIHTEQDCLDRAKVFRTLCLDIEQNGFKESTGMHFNPKTKLAYGPLTVQLIDKHYKLIDGHHRAAIMIALGHTELNCDEFVYSYQDMFPPEEKLKNLKFDWFDRSVVELGCNIGKLEQYVINRGAASYQGFDHKNEYIEEGLSRNPDANIQVMRATEIKTNPDVLVALGVFHHLQPEAIQTFLKNNPSEYLLFECPVGHKPLDPYKVRPKEWYFDMIGGKEVREFKYGFQYPIDRTIFLVKR